VLAGQPAVTRHRFGAGTAWYVSTGLDEAGLAKILGEMVDQSGVVPLWPEPAAGVELVRRRGDGMSCLFALNHTDSWHEVAARGTDLLTGAVVDGTLRLPPFGVAVVHEA